MFRPILFEALAGIAFGSLWPPARADLEGPLTVRIDSLSLSQFPQVQSTVTVLDPAGNPVIGLPPDAFQASAEGEALRGVQRAGERVERRREVALVAGRPVLDVSYLVVT